MKMYNQKLEIEKLHTLIELVRLLFGVITEL